MTRKHFIEIAANIASIEDLYIRKELANASIDIYQKINPRFDSNKFLKACGL